MAPNLKKDFPQLPIRLLTDSLYAAAPFFKTARKNKWRFIATFKEGSIPNFFDEFRTLKKISPENSARRQDDNSLQLFRRVNRLDYADMLLSVIECIETNGKTGEKKHLVRITDMEVTPSNYLHIAAPGSTILPHTRLRDASLHHTFLSHQFPSLPLPSSHSARFPTFIPHRWRPALVV